MTVFRIAVLLCCALGGLQAQSVELAKVASRPVERTLRLPGEFFPYQRVELHARVTGFVERVPVDRGSAVKQGDLRVVLSAPEMTAQVAEAEAKAQVAEAHRAEAEAKVVAVESTYERLKTAAATPGAVAGIELIQAEKALEAARASLRATEMAAKAAASSVAALRELEGYLKVTAPFEGVITERFVHPGALVGPAAGGPLLKLEQVSRLRLVVSVPESAVAGIVPGARVSFAVPAHPGEAFSGLVARIPRSIDPATRTMPVELDVANPRGRLTPGMYPEVQWPVRTGKPSLVAPVSSVVTTSERRFVIRARDGKAEWVDVETGPAAEGLVEIQGKLREGDLVVLRASDEIRQGTPLTTR